MLGRISARAGVRRKREEAGEDGQAPAIKKGFGPFRRTPASATIEEAAPESDETPNRFAPVRLSTVEERQPGFLARRRASKQQARPQAQAITRFSRPGEAATEQHHVPSTKVVKTGAVRWFDRGLLAIELVGALVVAWLAFQYIYTVYIDTGSRRLSPNAVVQQLNKATMTPTIKPTATRFVEVAPPMTGEGSDEDGSTGVGPAVEATATGTPEIAPTKTPQPLATATIDPQRLLPTRLRIPVMFLDSPVHEVTINLGEWEVSEMDIGHHEGTGNPGQAGNVVLAGHRDVNSALFRELDRLTPGDEVFVSNEVGEYRYVVQDIFEVSPDDTWVMEPTNDKRVTLITCTPIGLATKRLVVVAVLDES